jgi:hypothetical protein
MPMWDEMNQPMNTPLPQPPVHEVIIDEESKSKTGITEKEHTEP